MNGCSNYTCPKCGVSLQPVDTALVLEAQIHDLADRHFKRDLASRLKKLGEEIGELAEAIVRKDKASILEEAADCNNVLTDIAHVAGGSLVEAQRKKFAVLLSRERIGLIHKEDRIRATPEAA
jgi:NTP pyrophosphatase (non-canonical NTP hydrolase)